MRAAEKREAIFDAIEADIRDTVGIVAWVLKERDLVVAKEYVESCRSSLGRHNGDRGAAAGAINRASRECLQRARSTPEGHEKRRAGAKRRRRDNSGGVLLASTVRRARSRGLDHDLTLEDMERLVGPMVCSTTGLPLSHDWGGDGANPWAPSIDRIDSSKGYVLSNVQMVCWAYNRAKSAWPPEIVSTLARALASRPPESAS